MSEPVERQREAHDVACRIRTEVAYVLTDEECQALATAYLEAEAQLAQVERRFDGLYWSFVVALIGTGRQPESAIKVVDESVERLDRAALADQGASDE